jgi:hypothetical protein
VSAGKKTEITSKRLKPTKIKRLNPSALLNERFSGRSQDNGTQPKSKNNHFHIHGNNWLAKNKAILQNW